MFQSSLDSILAYVGTVSDIAAGEGGEPSVGVRYNVLRPDVITEPSGSHAEVLLAAMPKRDGDYLSVKKILNQPE